MLFGAGKVTGQQLIGAMVKTPREGLYRDFQCHCGRARLVRIDVLYAQALVESCI